MGNGLLTDVSSTEDTTGASNADGSFDSGAPEAPFAAQPQHEKANKKKLWLENGMRKRGRHGGHARSVLGRKPRTSARRGGRGRRPLPGVGASGLRRGTRPAAAQHLFRLRLRFCSSLLLQALGPVRMTLARLAKKKKSHEALNKIYLQNFFYRWM